MTGNTSLEMTGQRQPRTGAATTLVSTTTRVEPVDLLAAFQRHAGDERALWHQPSARFSMLAVGAVARLSARGAERFAQVGAARRRLLATAVIEQADDCPIPAPILIGGFAFDTTRPSSPEWDGFPDALLVLPRLLFIRQGESCWLTANTLDNPDGDVLPHTAPGLSDTCESMSEGDLSAPGREASEEAWKASVEQAVARIKADPLDKLVLARRACVSLPQTAAVAAALGRLVEGYPGCTVFAFAHGDACFLGATPEQLVRVSRPPSGATGAPGRVTADCLAGSAPRSATDEEDRRLGETLLADEKERYEHSVVVQSLRDDLEPICSQLDIPETPGLLRMPNVQHLHTPITGILNSERGVLELVERLHPTPAAGGLPREFALPMIRQLESFDRGWYAGPVGWVDGHGDGEFAVAIRSALVRGREALLYAGCGIVAASDADKEYAESSMKMRPMLWALNGTTG